MLKDNQPNDVEIILKPKKFVRDKNFTLDELYISLEKIKKYKREKNGISN